ncbi:MAG: hypothetical protein ACE5H8_08030 [Alphaproteobacteria bacterium]
MLARPGLDEPGITEDMAAVQRAADAMRVGEFDVFRRAYRRWFGHDADEPRIERDFVAYLFRGQAPYWVRRFCRRVAGEPALSIAARRAPSAPEVEPRVVALVALAAVAFLFVALSAGAPGMG